MRLLMNSKNTDSYSLPGILNRLLRHGLVWGILLVGSSQTQAQTQANVDLQSLLDQTPAHGVLLLTEGVYKGPVVINKPLVLDGQGHATIDGGGIGTVITLRADGVTLQNLRITHSGDSHDHVDAAVAVKSSHNLIQKNIIYNTLFGLDFKESNDNLVSDNDISSKSVNIGARGDAIRVWAGHRNIFRGNQIHDSRDMVIWYAENNLIEHNKGWNNRYSLHFMNAGANQVRHNNYQNNTVGIFVMFSDGIVLEHNTIQGSLGVSGVGMGFKEVNNISLRFNTIISCTMGLYFDQSPLDPSEYNHIIGNRIGYNLQGIVFHSSLSHNVFKGNLFTDNLEMVVVQANGNALQNIWEGNYWNDYEGLDRDHNGYGDSPYLHYAYLDQLWLDDPWVRFYFGSPVLSMINFLAKLAPFSTPRLLVKDTKPVFQPDRELLLSEKNSQFQLPVEEDDEASFRPLPPGRL